MKKKKLIKKLLILFIVPAIYFTGCNKHDEITSPRDFNFDSPQYAIIDYNDLINGIDDATLDTDLSFNSSLFAYTFMSSNDFKPGNAMALLSIFGNGNWMVRFDWLKHIGPFIRSLNLTDDQKSKIRGFAQSYHDAIRPLVKQFKDANKDIITAANVERKAISDDLKAGKITRQEAGEKIKALNERTKNAIENNPASLAVKRQMCELRTSLFSNIASVLTRDQITKWNNAISKIPNPC